MAAYSETCGLYGRTSAKQKGLSEMPIADAVLIVSVCNLHPDLRHNALPTTVDRHLT